MSTQPRCLIPVALFLFCSSCVTQKNIIDKDLDRNYGKTLQHAYQPLIKGENPTKSGMYTYVLMRKGIGLVDKNTPHEKRLRALIQNITYTLPIENGTRTDTRYFNLFLYPSHIPEYKIDVSVASQYNFDHSKEIVEKFINLLSQADGTAVSKTKLVQSRLNYNDGPFLISMKEPHNIISSEKYILFADLSKYTPKVIPLIVDEYKKQVRIDGQGVTEFKSIRLNSIDVLLKFNLNAKEVYNSLITLKLTLT